MVAMAVGFVAVASSGCIPSGARLPAKNAIKTDIIKSKEPESKFVAMERYKGSTPDGCPTATIDNTTIHSDYDSAGNETKYFVYTDDAGKDCEWKPSGEPLRPVEVKQKQPHVRVISCANPENDDQALVCAAESLGVDVEVSRTYGELPSIRVNP